MGFTDVSVFHAIVQDFHKFMVAEGSLLEEVFDEDSFFGILSYVEFFFFWFEEIYDLLVVKLKV